MLSSVGLTMLCIAERYDSQTVLNETTSDRTWSIPGILVIARTKMKPIAKHHNDHRLWSLLSARARSKLAVIT